jgi:hypothetical protein
LSLRRGGNTQGKEPLIPSRTIHRRMRNRMHRSWGKSVQIRPATSIERKAIMSIRQGQFKRYRGKI